MSIVDNNVVIAITSRTLLQNHIINQELLALMYSDVVIACDFEMDNSKTSCKDLSFLAFIKDTLKLSNRFNFPKVLILKGNYYLLISKGELIATNFSEQLLKQLNLTYNNLSVNPSFNGINIDLLIFEKNQFKLQINDDNENRNAYLEISKHLNEQNNFESIKVNLIQKEKYNIKINDIKNPTVLIEVRTNLSDHNHDNQFSYIEFIDNQKFLKQINKETLSSEINYDLPYFINDSAYKYEEVINKTVTQFLDYYTKIKDKVTNLVIGLSGGLDSALTLVLLCIAFDKAKISRKHIHALIMPSCESSIESVDLACKLATILGVSYKIIDISPIVDATNFALANKEKNIMYENSQARIRTSIILNYCNLVSGAMIGTTDFSEFCLGFITFGGDLVSSYQMIKGFPKVLVQAMVRYFALKYKNLETILTRIVERPISPELISGQDTQKIIGLYEINDFILYLIINNVNKNEIITKIIEKFHLSKKDAVNYYNNFKNRYFTNKFKLDHAARGSNPLGISFDDVDVYFKKIDE